VRLLAVLGGAFVLLILGAAAAGAAESHAEVAPSGPITVTMPLPDPTAPLLPPDAGLAAHAPGVDVDAGGPGVAVTAADPVGFVPTPPDLPLPLPSPTIPLPPALPLPVPRPVDPATAARALGQHPPVAADARPDGGAPRATSVATSAAPAPARPVDTTPDAPLTLALAGLALGLQLTTRHGGLDDHLVTSGPLRAMRRHLRTGRAALARALAPRPGFGLLLTRPG
jgi:hypothetical protein